MALPDVTPEAEAITDWLSQSEPAQRRPAATAKVLALIVALYRDGKRPWPIRPQVCDHLGVALPTLDKALERRQHSGHISVDDRYNPKLRITERFITPSKELLAVGRRYV